MVVSPTSPTNNKLGCIDGGGGRRSSSIPTQLLAWTVTHTHIYIELRSTVANFLPYPLQSIVPLNRQTHIRFSKKPTFVTAATLTRQPILALFPSIKNFRKDIKRKKETTYSKCAPLSPSSPAPCSPPPLSSPCPGKNGGPQ